MSSSSRAATLRLVGGRPCLDLVNTVSWRGDESRLEEHLTDDRECLVWCRRAGVVSAEEEHALAGLDVRRPLLALRRAVTDHLADVVTPDLAALRPFVDDALRHSELVLDQGRAGWQVTALTVGTPAYRIALDLLDQLTDPPGPIGRCDDPACGWVFVDTSRGHRRRWCSSADCGNRERVRRHAARGETP
jgi:predicted RNA-binding Zn ribbon-like protein